jgi:hypothetical protein
VLHSHSSVSNFRQVDRMRLGSARFMASYDREGLTEGDMGCFYEEDPEDPLVSGVVSVNIKHFMAFWCADGNTRCRGI